ncbi:hypothetical protein Sme01_25980 [Sphaerisporangium melleum]|uniref:Uncharacterized protein n=1 Tax=Sphaerisporangium melleum TaxID=321316 RepID=A0A917VD13_9ACTN|nr:hypothetical protein [Sphaerisporangium melleum]GGK64096.1 hypothetical protein GCM10007964_03960 [Sphaerisporangium melleum]GII70122.1 hypothetical protein Sme01_25980 [Sphaerisporangium melleum]
MLKPDPNLCLTVPADFDDADADSQVHPMARLILAGATAADAFGQAQEWVAAHNVFLVDVSWSYETGEDRPFVLSIYFVFEDPSEE